jgi:hypothetical protein
MHAHRRQPTQKAASEPKRAHEMTEAGHARLVEEAKDLLVPGLASRGGRERERGVQQEAHGAVRDRRLVAHRLEHGLLLCSRQVPQGHKSG